MGEVNVPWVLERLKHSLQALAMPAGVQISLFPDFVPAADELALVFDDWRLVVQTNGETFVLTETQARLIQRIDERFQAMWDPDRDLWTRHALEQRPEWQLIRELATEALAAFEWPVEQPPSYAHEFVPLKRAPDRPG